MRDDMLIFVALAILGGTLAAHVNWPHIQPGFSLAQLEVQSELPHAQFEPEARH